MYRKGFNTTKLMDKLDVEIRNVQIVTSWDILSLLTKMKYVDKIKYLTQEYHLSDKAIEKILREARDLDVPWD
tara:strand:+ start:253 stop:471 length:219 start_codon:yes stop_codon:yes gene_type:complete